MRGKDTLYSLISEPSPQRAGEQGQRNAFLDERDRALAYRFYFHGNLCRRSYEKCLNELSREFFLAPNTIITRLGLVDELLRELKQKATPVAELRKRCSWFNWTVMNTQL